MADISGPAIRLEQEYANFLKRINLQRARVACILGAVLVVASSLLDYFMHPDFSSIFLSIRITCAVFVMGVYSFSFTEFGKKRGLLIGMLVVLSIAAAISAMIRFLGYETPYYAGLNLIILAIGVLFPWRVKESLFACLAIYGMYLVPILIFDELSNYRIFVNNNLFILETIIIAIAANYFTSKLRYQEFMGRYRLNEAYEQLKGLDELKTQFFSNISHELRTPLTLVLAPAESILKGEAGNLTTQTHNLVETIHSNTLRLLKLINNLLDLSKIDAGKMSVNYEKLELNEFIKGIIAEISHVADKKNLSLEFNEGKDIPPFCFDPDKIEKVLLNIIYNSIKFTDEGGKITITTHTENNNAVVKIRDTGIGIEEKDLGKIFDRFVQIDGSQKRRYEGTGIGLPLAKELVELHKGNIKAESEIDKGTTITFSLPLVLEHTEKLSPTKEDDWTKAKYKDAIYSTADIISPVREERQSVKSVTDGKKILVVEDNVDMLNFIAFQLEKEYRVFKAYDGKEGFEIAHRELPDLIIADIMMPLMDGHELCQMIKNNDRTKHIPLIFLTAKAGLDMKIEGLEKGADEYLVKPFNAEELKARVRSLLNLRRLEREIQERNEELEKTLMQLKETQAQLVHSEKMVSLGQLVAGVAHEMNNPIYSSLLITGTLDKYMDEKRGCIIDEAISTEVKHINSIIKTGLEQSAKIVENLRDFSKKDIIGFKTEDIHKGLEVTLQLLHHRLDDRITIHKNYDPKIGMIECSLGQLNQVFLNILQNAIDAIKNKGDIWITTSKFEDKVKISIKDTGIGIKEDNLKHIFDPFFTTKDIGEGIGLGMSISYRLIQNHNGNIDVMSKYGEGTEVIITIPEKHKEAGS